MPLPPDASLSRATSVLRQRQDMQGRISASVVYSEGFMVYRLLQQSTRNGCRKVTRPVSGRPVDEGTVRVFSLLSVVP